MIYTEQSGIVDYHGIEMIVYLKYEDGVLIESFAKPYGDFTSMVTNNPHIIKVINNILPIVTLH